MPPRPIRSKPLSAYPLATRRPPVSSCGVEEARKVMERAREHAGVGEGSSPREGDGENHFDGIKRNPLVAERIRSLIRATWEDVKDWCDQEAEARVRRKDSQVGHRRWLVPEFIQYPARPVQYPCSRIAARRRRGSQYVCACTVRCIIRCCQGAGYFAVIRHTRALSSTLASVP